MTENIKIIHIIGTSHASQARSPNAERTSDQIIFANFPEHTIKAVRPSLVAEEQSEENVLALKVISIVKEVADAEQIEHKFCDPTEAERTKMGYVQGWAIH